MEYTFENIRNKGLLLYEYVRGSQAYGLALPTSDEDRGAVYIMDKNDIYGFTDAQINQVNDEKNDTSWYEIGKYLDLLCEGNPTMIESLFVPEKHIKYMHPAFKVIYDNRDMFVTKRIKGSFSGFATNQIAKARGLNKKIVNPVTEKKDILDFCYTFKGQGTTPFKKWLNKRGLFARYCGLVHLPNMEQIYGVYYDFGNHFKHQKIYTHKQMSCALREYIMKSIDVNASSVKNELIDEFIKASKANPIGYRGAMDEDDDTTQLRLSSVEKGALPICYIAFNENGFKTHRKQYREYNEWVEKRNPQRYLENQEKEFDRKNMMHCARLLTMGIEIIKTGQVNVDRSNIDREFLLNIRLGNSTYDDLMSYMKSKKDELEAAMTTCTLPLMVNRDDVNQILIELRKKFYDEQDKSWITKLIEKFKKSYGK